MEVPLGTKGVTIFIPVPWKLARNEQGRIICGPGTEEACDYAAQLALKTPRSEILLTATVPTSPVWDGVIMSQLMAEHIACRYPELSLRYEKSPHFNTHGDVIAAAEYLKRCERKSVVVQEIVYIVKAWHKPRLKLYVDSVFSQHGVTTPVRYETQDIPASIYDRILRECVAWIVAIHRLRNSR